MKYEVQHKDGLGAWRRWLLTGDKDVAEKSLQRLRERIGSFPGSKEMARIVERPSV